LASFRRDAEKKPGRDVTSTQNRRIDGVVAVAALRYQGAPSLAFCRAASATMGARSMNLLVTWTARTPLASSAPVEGEGFRASRRWTGWRRWRTHPPPERRIAAALRVGTQAARRPGRSPMRRGQREKAEGLRRVVRHRGLIHRTGSCLAARPRRRSRRRPIRSRRR